MGTKHPKAPPGCYWRGDTLWGRTRSKGRLIGWSLRTDNPKIAAQRRKQGKERVVALANNEDVTREFVDVMELWATWIGRQVGPKTVQRYGVSLDQMRPWLDGNRLDEITGKLVAIIIRARQAADATNATIKRDLVALSSVMNFAMDQGWIDENPVLSKMRRLKERRDPITLPERAHIALVLARAAKRGSGMIADMARIAEATGARQEELYGALRNQVDHDKRQLTVIGKGNKRRVIDLDPFGGYDLIRALPAYAGSMFLFWHSEGANYKNFASEFSNIATSIFIEHYDAKHGTNDTTRPHITELRKAAKGQDWVDIGFVPFRFHDLRHLHAVQWLRDGRSIYDLKERLGHSSVKTTEMYCEFLTAEEKRIAMGLAQSTAKPNLKVVASSV